MLLFFRLCPPSIILWRPVVQWAACGLVLRGSGLLSEVHRSESRSGFGVQVSKKKKKNPHFPGGIDEAHCVPGSGI